MLQSGLEQWGVLFAKSNAAVYQFCITADLYIQQAFTGVIALSQGCCRPVSQSSIKHWGMRFAHTTAAVHWSCIAADLYEEQTFTGVTAVSQGCCRPVLQEASSIGACVLPIPLLQCIGFASLQTCMYRKPS